MNLLKARATATSYPTDVALQKLFHRPGRPLNELIPVSLGIAPSSGSVSLGTTPVVGVEVSVDGKTTWTTDPILVATDTTRTIASQLPNGCYVRPTFTTGGGTPSVNATLSP